MKNLFCLLSILILAVSCSRSEKQNKNFPADNLYRQRVYPAQALNYKAINQAIDYTKSLKSVKTSSSGQWENIGMKNIGGRIEHAR